MDPRKLRKSTSIYARPVLPMVHRPGGAKVALSLRCQWKGRDRERACCMTSDDADRLLGWLSMLLDRLCVWGSRKSDGRGRQWSGAGRVCCLKRQRHARVVGRRRRGWGRQVPHVLQRQDSTLLQMERLFMPSGAGTWNVLPPSESPPPVPWPSGAGRG